MRKIKEKDTIRKEKRKDTRYGFLLFGSIKGAGMAALIAWLFFESLWGLLCLPVCITFFLLMERKRQKEKEKQREQQLFAEFLGFLREALRVGYSLEKAVEEAKRGMLTTVKEEDPFLREIIRVQRKMALGKPVESAFSEWARTAACEDIRDFCEVLYIAKRTGGAVRQAITNTERVIREKQETNRYVQSVLRSREYEAKVMKAMPFAILLYLRMFMPDFLKPLYHNTVGIAIMMTVLAVYLVLWLITDKVTAISV